MCRGDYAYSVLTDWLTVYVVGDLVLDLDSVEIEKVKKCIMINTLQDDFRKIYWSFIDHLLIFYIFLHYSQNPVFILNDSDIKSNIYYVYIIYLFTSQSIQFFPRKI